MKRLDLSKLKQTIKFYPHDVQKEILQNMGRFSIIASGKRLGKDLDITTPIMTTEGFKNLSDIVVGDFVFSEIGKPVRVLYKSEIFTKRNCYRVVLSDGTELVAGETHDWVVEDFKYRKNTVRAKNSSSKMLKMTTKELAKNLFYNQGGQRHHNLSIPVTAPLEFEKVDLPIDPYFLGLWLGDGTSRTASITTADEEIVKYIYSFAAEHGKSIRTTRGSGSLCNTYHIRGDGSQASRDSSVQATLRSIGVLKNKHIPDAFKRSSVNQRLELLRGLMDSDGYVDTTGSCEFTSTKKKLADDVLELLLSLGVKPVMYTGDAKLYGVVVSKKYRIHFTTSLSVFRLTRKNNRQCGDRGPDIKRRFIVSVTKAESVPTQCLMVDNPRHLFLAGRSLVPTHNTILAAYLGLRELFYPYHSVWVIAPTLDLTSRVWEYLDLWIDRYFGGDQGPFRVNKADKIIENKLTGARLWTKSGESPESLLGKGLDLAIIDEASRMKKGLWDGYIRPNLMDKKGKSFFISNPYGFNWFYDLYLKGTDEKRLAEDGDPDYISFKYPTAIENERGDVIGTNNPMAIDVEELRRIKANTPIDIWKSEYLATFQEGAGMLFKNFTRCIDDKIRVEDYNNWFEQPDSSHLYTIGVDIAKVEDFTVMCVMDRMTHRLVGFYRINNVTWEMMATRLKQYSERFNNAIITLDATGNAGDMFVESLSNMGVGVDTEYKYTNKSKVALIDKLAMYLQDARIKFPHIPQLVDEIRSFTYEVSDRTKKMHYGSSKKDDCVPPWTLIKTLDGWKEIKDVTIGDRVLTHTGKFKNVKRTGARRLRSNEKVYDINATGRLLGTITEDHQMYVSKNSIDTKSRKNTIKILDGIWEPVKNINKEYWTSFIIDNTEEDYFIDMSKYVPDTYKEVNDLLVPYFKNSNKHKQPKGNNVNKNIPVDNDLAMVLGYFAAEGTFGEHNISFASHEKETGVRDFVNNWFKNQNLNLWCKKTSDHGVTSSFGSIPFRNFFSEFGKGSIKKYPEWVLKLPLSQQMNVLIGHSLGDGCFVDGTLRINTISKVMALQLYEMFCRTGYRPLISYVNNKYNKQYIVSLSRTDAQSFIKNINKSLMVGKSINIMEINADQTMNRWKDNILFSRVRSVSTSLYSGLVYNLEVEDDHSYLTEFGIVHNCVNALALACWDLNEEPLEETTGDNIIRPRQKRWK